MCHDIFLYERFLSETKNLETRNQATRTLWPKTQASKKGVRLETQCQIRKYLYFQVIPKKSVDEKFSKPNQEKSVCRGALLGL
ncbi:unnamed protein product [Ceutorhynchus assimilis]|uniref:Uncharacterized protein n=1 Tax=Ceutorhynchus assimilis TaxID=467358 RepID=A0A9N9MP02_9CUCU|nr:unnamed protein product [Ceutorhynchus assimilis]